VFVRIYRARLVVEAIGNVASAAMLAVDGLVSAMKLAGFSHREDSYSSGTMLSRIPHV